MGASVQMGGRGRRGGIVGINVTPFVDITLVLLIIMMVSSTYIVSQALKVELPKSASSDETTSRTYVVTITGAGELSFNDQPTTLEALGNQLKAARAEKEVQLVITADRTAQHGRVVEVIDTAKQANVTKFAINVERSSKR
jgi:biopolymer transport protein ExbD